MTIRPRIRVLLPLLTLTLALATATTALAQTSASFQVTFGSTPHWTSVRGTRVQEIRTDERPNYDMFRYGGGYYVYNDNRWYMSRRGRGQFRAIDERRVPSELTQVSKDHWHNYPSSWQDENGNSRYGHNQGRGRGNRQAQPADDRGHH